MMGVLLLRIGIRMGVAVTIAMVMAVMTVMKLRCMMLFGVYIDWLLCERV